MPDRDKGEIDKSKASIGEKRPSTIDTGSSLRKKRKSSKLTYQAVLHDDDLETIADRVYDTILAPITAIIAAQEVLKQTIETQIIELKKLVNHAPVIDLEGNRHRFVIVTPISI